MTDEPSDDEFRVATYNVHRCVGTDGRCDASRIARVLGELACDTIGLQEVDTRSGPGHDSMQLDYLAAALRMHAVPGLTILRHDGHYGNALLTRRRVLAVRRHDLSFRTREPRGMLDVDLDVSGETVRVIVMHLGLRPSERRYQVQRVMGLLKDMPLTQRLVLLGDINEWLPFGRPLRWLHVMFGRPPAVRSFPVWLPVLALDRVWASPRGTLLRLSAHRSSLSRLASDHLPVTAVVSLARASRA